MGMSSNKPYLIRAIYDWIVDNNLTPYILVDAEYPGVQVPEAHVNGGKIILNISPQACRGLHLENDRIIFTARFSGQTVQIVVVPAAVIAIYARENGRGMEFGVEYDEAKSPDLTSEPSKMKAKSKPSLTLVKKD
ncbi:ClpXP protease specificity-enhancing factor [Legionella spiritensis]|uniref:ClpXP protease specificity-enhancing factor n=1 Tax=Legionella spiritensis TaxID=452 RepID=A0A0W0Z5E7_LEGSP|nr:ClpXP protease specificity-enhancing factor [Legionella spiritensis]KTD64377.1 ClpXP protease specificity-enhancing factor [Legionella spiritensis]SNV46223.1 stringent starvation protein B [Legionella spiritensis]